jgi:hypothetical protein
MFKIKLCKQCRKELKQEDGIFCSDWCKEQEIEIKKRKTILKNKKPKIIKIKKVKILMFPFKCLNCKKRLSNKGFCSPECRTEKHLKYKKYYLKRKLSTVVKIGSI